MSQNKSKIWLGIGRIVLASGIFVTSVLWASAQSTSSSYKAVDFINPEASLSASSSYKLNDSIDYYGGVNASSSYKECTGDHAVLSACGGTVVVPPTPPTPPTPPPIGAGGDHPDHQDCNKLDCITDEPPVDENPPVEEPVEPTKPFVLPNIKEPVPEPVKPSAPKPVVETVKVTPTLVNKVIEKVIEEVLPNDPLCQDLICAQASLLIAQGEKLRGAAENVCTVYTYGGFAFRGGCENIVFFWVTSMVIALLGAVGETVHRERKRRKSKT